MTLRRLIIVVGLIGMLAIFLIFEQSRITRAGYSISRLSHDETKLVEQVRILNVQVTKLRQPEFLEQQVQKMRIDLMRLPQDRIIPVAVRTPEADQ